MKQITVLFIMVAMFFVTSGSKAQTACPTDIAPNGSGAPAWTHATKTIHISCPSGTCDVTFEYCERTLYNYPTAPTQTTQTVVVGPIYYSGDCDCSDQSRFNQIADWLQKNEGTSSNCDQPGYTPTYAETYRYACWKKLQDVDGNGYPIPKAFHYTPCTDSRCKIKCKMCYHPATTTPPAPAYVTKEDCTTGTVGTPGCEYLNPWNVGDCGLVDCSSNPN